MNLDPTKLCQMEILVSDVDRALTFYEKVFGWKRLPAELHEYIVLEVPENCGFGISLVPQTVMGALLGKLPLANSRMVLYFKVDDPAQIAALAEEHGGKLRFGPKRLESYGEIFQIEDPDGQRFGLIGA